MIRALILDLDNTIYPVPEVGEDMFGSLFQLIERDGDHTDEMQRIKYELMRKPFQLVSEKYKFSEVLKSNGMSILKDLTYDKPLKTFEDYFEVKNIDADRYLVTAGFRKLQWSKIYAMGIENDFRDIYVLDNTVTDRTKKDLFKEIMENHNYAPSEIVVVGDDPESELQGGEELGMHTILFDRSVNDSKFQRIGNYRELKQLIQLFNSVEK